MSVEEYLALDAASEEKYEFLSGVAVAMSGAAPRHNLIAANIIGSLGRLLAKSPCIVFDQGQRVQVAATGSYVYPDVSVACAPHFTGERPRSLTNPRLLVEILSESTRTHDLGAKFGHYRRMAEVPELLFVEPDEHFVSHYRRLETGQWLITDFTEGDIALVSLELALPMLEVYAKADSLPLSME